MRTFSRAAFAVALSLTASARAADMQLTQQGRVLDLTGTPVSGTHALQIRFVDGGDTVRFSESFPVYDLQEGYFSVILGAGATPLPTSVFLDHGAMDLEVVVDAQPMSRVPVGGYPFVVAQQSLLAQEATAQQVLTSLGSMQTACAEGPAYIESCDGWAAAGWSSEAACLEDGRWHIYATTTGTFDSHPKFVAWHQASVNGADTKVRLGTEWYEVSVRSTNDPNSAVWVFGKELGRHFSFLVNASGDITDMRLGTTANAGYHPNFYGSSLGNWHYFSYDYPSGVNPDESVAGGVSFWARH